MRLVEVHVSWSDIHSCKIKNDSVLRQLLSSNQAVLMVSSALSCAQSMIPKPAHVFSIPSSSCVFFYFLLLHEILKLQQESIHPILSHLHISRTRKVHCNFSMVVEKLVSSCHQSEAGIHNVNT